METQEKSLKDILEIVNFIKDNAASKEELAEIKVNMATKEELAMVKEDLAIVKVTMATKEDLDELRQEMKSDFNQLITTVDHYAKKSDDYFQEMKVLSHKVNRHEDWIHLVAKELELSLEY